MDSLPAWDRGRTCAGHSPRDSARQGICARRPFAPCVTHRRLVGGSAGLHAGGWWRSRPASAPRRSLASRMTSATAASAPLSSVARRSRTPTDCSARWPSMPWNPWWTPAAISLLYLASRPQRHSRAQRHPQKAREQLCDYQRVFAIRAFRRSARAESAAARQCESCFRGSPIRPDGRSHRQNSICSQLWQLHR